MPVKPHALHPMIVVKLKAIVAIRTAVLRAMKSERMFLVVKEVLYAAKIPNRAAPMKARRKSNN
jgi:hypothetical protein